MGNVRHIIGKDRCPVTYFASCLSWRRYIKLILIRHGETVWNRQGIIQGSGSDTELSEVGNLQAEKVGLALREMPLSAIYSSPLKRAMDTAGAVARYHDLEIIPDAGLAEIYVGEMEGMPLEKLGQNFSQFLVDWQSRGEAVNFSGGENLGQFKDRVWAAVEKIVAVNPTGTVAIVSHYFVTTAIVCQALGLPISHLVRIRIQPSSITILEFDQGQPPRLLLLSDICHLRERA